MALKSTFRSDLKKEQQLSLLLDGYYGTFLKHYTFDRVTDIQNQMAGIDLIFTHKTNGQAYTIDEKAQLDYVNEDLPTFAFEIRYEKNGGLKDGWLFDAKKKTDFYALVTGIYTDEPGVYTSCKVTLVNRKKLIEFLASRKITPDFLVSEINKHPEKHAKLTLARLHSKKEGYLYFSTRNKAEKPVNLILRLDFLVSNGVAKRLV